MNLLQIDELVLSQHYYLEPSDLCFYIKEYTAYAGYSHSYANDLIQNFKKPMDRRGTQEWKWKIWAIDQITQMFIESQPETPNLSHIIFVPIPPSKVKTDPLYDDRIVQVTSAFCKARNGDFREILTIKENLEPSHEAQHRPKPSEIEANLHLNSELCHLTKDNIILVDDMITTGAHFKACQSKLRVAFPNAIIKGMFITRRAVRNDFFIE
jgi:hypothetical protein